MQCSGYDWCCGGCCCFAGVFFRVKSSSRIPNNVKPSISTATAHFSREFEQMETTAKYTRIVWCFKRLIRFVDHHLVHPLTQSHTFAPPHSPPSARIVLRTWISRMPKTDRYAIRARQRVFDDGCTSWQCTQQHNILFWWWQSQFYDVLKRFMFKFGTLLVVFVLIFFLFVSQQEQGRDRK